jgi:hypothetical protein
MVWHPAKRESAIALGVKLKRRCMNKWYVVEP